MTTAGTTVPKQGGLGCLPGVSPGSETLWSAVFPLRISLRPFSVFGLYHLLPLFPAVLQYPVAVAAAMAVPGARAVATLALLTLLPLQLCAGLVPLPLPWLSKPLAAFWLSSTSAV